MIVLDDQTDPLDAIVQLKFALDAEVHWQQRIAAIHAANSLSSFLQDVASNVPHYRGTAGATPLTLASFRVTRRAEVDRDGDAFLHPDHTGHDSRFTAATNGTVGPQLKVRMDAAGWYELNYGTYAALAAAWPELSMRMQPNVPGVYFINNNPYQLRTSVYLPPLGLAVLRQLIIGRSVEEDAVLVELLRTSEIPLLYGKPASLVALADADAARGGVRIAPAAILVSGESLFDDQRARLEAWFRCRVINAYVSTEGGLIALECRHRHGLHVRSPLVRIEVLGREGEISETGEGELLLTNLVNRGHVFVRYALGDHASVDVGECSCGFAGATITALRGRETAEVTLCGVAVAASEIEAFMCELPLREFQVFQTGSQVPLLKWVPFRADPTTIVSIARRIDAWLEGRGWTGAVVSTPLGRITPPGGKNRRFVRAER